MSEADELRARLCEALTAQAKAEEELEEVKADLAALQEAAKGSDVEVLRQLAERTRNKGWLRKERDEAEATLASTCVLALCETRKLALKPGLLYRFEVYKDCEDCLDCSRQADTWTSTRTARHSVKDG